MSDSFFSHENRFGVPPSGGFLKSPTKVGTTNFSSLSQRSVRCSAFSGRGTKSPTKVGTTNFSSLYGFSRFRVMHPDIVFSTVVHCLVHIGNLKSQKPFTSTDMPFHNPKSKIENRKSFIMPATAAIPPSGREQHKRHRGGSGRHASRARPVSHHRAPESRRHCESSKGGGR